MTGVKLPDIRLDGRVAIVTGADRGLGRAMSFGLAAAGATVVAASPDVPGCEAVARGIAEAGFAEAHAHEVDITDLASCRRLVADTVEKAGRLDVLFNNARRPHRGPGIPPEGNSLPVHETDPDIYRETVEVNVIGTFFMTRAAVEHFLGAGGGKVINLTTSIRNFHGRHNSPYGPTKAAIESQTLIWAKDLAEAGITVNSLLPGRSCDSDPERPGREEKDLLPPEIMNPLAVWLASPRSDGVTGCRFVGMQWDPDLEPEAAAEGARLEPVFTGQEPGTFAPRGV